MSKIKSYEEMMGIEKTGVSYTLAQLEADIDKIDTWLATIRKDRGKRYGSAEDTLYNVREADPEGSWRGAFGSAMECMNRLRNMFMVLDKDQDLKDFENATDDLINFAYYIKILGRQKRIYEVKECDCGGL